MTRSAIAIVAALVLSTAPALAGGHSSGGGVPLPLLEDAQPHPRFTPEERAHPFEWLHRLFDGDKASPPTQTQQRAASATSAAPSRTN